MENHQIQILRTIDKFDKIGRDGVVELLQKSPEEFGADLNPIQAELIGQFLGSTGKTNEETLDNIQSFFIHANRVTSRVDLMVALEETINDDGSTKWDDLINMRPNEDNTWNNGGRPDNIGWALDDIICALKELKNV